MNNNRLSQLLVIGLLFLLTACQGAGQPLSAAMVSSGDTVNGMGLTTGIADAPPLWAFCSNSPEGKGSYLVDCRVPVLASLNIGNIFLYADEAITNLDWSDLVWELSIDAQAVDLESFGTLDYVVPSMSKNPSRVREIFKRGTAWNIVLTGLEPGYHTLWFVAHSEADSYTWFVNLVIEEEEEVDISAARFPLHS